MSVRLKGICLAPSWTVLRRLVPGLLRCLAVLEHHTVPFRRLVVLRTAGPVIDLTKSVADDDCLGRGCALGLLSTCWLPLSLAPLPGRDRVRLRPQPTLRSPGLGFELCQPLILRRIAGIMPGIPRLYQHLTEVHAIGQLHCGDQLAAALSGVRGYGVHDDGNRLLEGDVTRELACLHAKGLPAFGTRNPVEVYL